MAKPSDTQHHDIERTDELPQLDVAAYEASLAQQAQAEEIARTDTWAFAARREPDAAATHRVPARNDRPFQPAPAMGARPVANDERIPKRISELEIELRATKAQNAELQARCEALVTERDAQTQTLAGLKTDHARLTEHRSIGQEMVDRLEQKLRDQSLQFTAQLKELQSARFDEHIKGEKTREELQQQTAQKAVQLAALQENHDKLREELQSWIDLATQRADSVRELRTLLAEEETSAEQLALQLASKLRDCDALSAMVDARNQTINELRSQTDDINSRWQRTLETVSELSAQLETANRELADTRTQQSANNSGTADAQFRIEQLTAEVERLANELQLAAQQHDTIQQVLASQQKNHSATQQEFNDQAQQLSQLRVVLRDAETTGNALERELTAARAVVRDEQNRRHTVEERLNAEQLNAEGLHAGLDFARSQLQALSAERDSLLSLRDELAHKTSTLTQSEQLLAEARLEIAELQSQSSMQTESVQAREAELVAAQAAANELRRERDTLNQGLDAAWQAAERLQAEAHTHLQLLHAKSAELAAAKQELSQHGPALSDLEHAVRARDELTDQLRAQLQTTQDEHAIMSGQLQKVRVRVKAMTEQIFHRDNQIAALKSDLAVHVEALAAIRNNVNRIDEEPPSHAGSELPRVLQPVDHDGDPIVLDRKLITVGRTSENDVCVPSKLISRHHARLLVSPHGVIVEDAGSTNGCFVNGKQVTQQLMQDGDILELGDLRFRLYSPSINDTRARANVIAFTGK